MNQLYNSGDEGVDEEKPQWDDDIDIEDIVPANSETVKKAKKKKKKKRKDIDGVEEGVDIAHMNADVQRVEDDEEWDGTEEMRKRKLDEYMDEIYELDFTDIVRIIFFHRRSLCQHHRHRSETFRHDSNMQRFKSSLSPSAPPKYLRRRMWS